MKHYSIKGLLCLLIYLYMGTFNVNAQTNFSGDYPQRQLQWVESHLDSMSLEQKIGQLFMVAAYSNKDEAHKKSISYLIKNHHIGGLIFFKGAPEAQVKLTNHFQLQSKIPLMIAIDGEWGLSMRLSDTPKYPRQLTLGAIQNEQLIYDMGKEIARQSKRMGIHVNLAPVVDVNNNPNNPVINDRSFGESRENVARKSVAYMQGMEMNGILACAKHFPGHGDTDKDSHHTLPVINHNRSRLDSVELFPFREMIKNGVGSIMTAHLAVPALDDSYITDQNVTVKTPTMPASLSKKMTTYLLKNELNYEGLIFTDALNMKGVSDYFEPGEVDLRALLAGNDILLFPENVGKAVARIKQALEEGVITEGDIDYRVRKILKAKFRLGLEKFKPISTTNLLADLNTKQSELLQRKLIAEALTVVRNEENVLPVSNLDQKEFASVSLGSTEQTVFQNTLNKYVGMSNFNIAKEAEPAVYQKMYDDLRFYSTVFIGVHEMSRYASKNHGISQQMLELIYKLQSQTKVVLVLVGSPYSLDKFKTAKTAVVAYQDDALTQDLTAQMLFGALPAKGRLPISASDSFYYGMGEDIQGSLRMEYSIPEDVGIKSENLKRIDTLVEQALTIRATPGCQVLIVKEGKVIMNKAYGYHTYNKKQAVSTNDLYDLASLTKISASLPVLMEMYDMNLLNLKNTLGDFLPELQGSNKENLLVKDVLTHHSRLASWIPFYAATLEDAVFKKTYRRQQELEFPYKVADGMFMNKSYADTIWHKIVDSNLRSRAGYKYSDLGYYFFHRMIENYGSEPMEVFVNKKFYKPLGMTSTGYNPLNQFDKKSIVPTERDNQFRNQLLQGYVHDMGAAMLGGVCGHAGLFSNANDLAKLMQMYLNGGVYGDEEYLQEKTLDLFSSQQRSDSRRGLGFDKPEFNRSRINPASDKASPSTFGHTGFTGTCVWIDPEYDLIYIFLSNRIHPNMNNRLLIETNVRTEIQDAIYDALADPIEDQAQ